VACLRFGIDATPDLCSVCHTNGILRQRLWTAHQSDPRSCVACAHRGEQAGPVEVECCGGRTATVASWSCGRRGKGVTVRDCSKCAEYAPRSTPAAAPPSRVPGPGRSSSLPRRLTPPAERREGQAERDGAAALWLIQTSRGAVALDANSLVFWSLPEAAAKTLRPDGRAGTYAPADEAERLDVLGRLFGTGEVPADFLSPTPPAAPNRGPLPWRANYLILWPTTRCNLRCDYCFARERAEEPQDMGLETALAFVGRFAGPRAPRIGWFGSEPLCNWPLIKEVAARVQPGHVHITTNAVALASWPDAEIAALASLKPSLIVSLDGPEELHDAHRRDNEGAGSHRRVLAALRRLASAGLGRRITLRATYGPGETEVVRRLDALNNLAAEGLAAGVAVEPWSLPPRDPRQWTAADWEPLAEEMAPVGDWWAGRRREGKPARFSYLDKNMGRCQKHQPLWFQCGAGRGYLTAAPDGTLYACHRGGPTEVGTLEGGFDSRRRALWDQAPGAARPGCVACGLRFFCGGGCAYDTIQETGGLGAVAASACAKAAVNARLLAEVLGRSNHHDRT
jgi:uncharacterized protein